MSINPAHVACIIGGAVAGSEAAARFASRGIRSVIIDMGPMPWGKIELGLPKWHFKQRDQEEADIDRKMIHPLVSFLPKTKVGVDLSFAELRQLGFSVILLAVGAWRDRPLGIPGIDAYENRGLYYQNPFVAWFNQCHDPSYAGVEHQIVDDAAVIGGGLASLDVVKIVMLELTRRAVQRLGFEISLFELEKKGIPRALESLGIGWEDLGIQGCTLYYRRRAQDMPLVPLEGDATPEQLAQAEKVREKLLDNFRRKYLFRFQPCLLPVDKVVEGDRLVGLIFRRTTIEAGRVREIPGSDYEIRTPLVISSIGSVPEPLPGVPMGNGLFSVSDPATGQLDGFDNVFVVGNSVTGRGNIRASRIHGRQVADWIMDHYFSWSAEDFSRLRELLEGADPDRLNSFAREHRLRTPEEVAQLYHHVAELQKRVGYGGDYDRWLEANAPARADSPE